MSRKITTIDPSASVAFSPEALSALGVEPGADLDVEIVGRAIVVRSVAEASRSRDFINAFESILGRRRAAYEQLDQTVDSFPDSDLSSSHADSDS